MVRVYRTDIVVQTVMYYFFYNTIRDNFKKLNEDSIPTKYTEKGNLGCLQSDSLYRESLLIII